MGTDHIIQELDAFIRTELLAGQHQKPIEPHEELLKSGLIDSIGFFRLLAFITDRFGVEHGDEELVPDNFRTLAIIARRVAQRRERQSTDGRSPSVLGEA